MQPYSTATFQQWKTADIYFLQQYTRKNNKTIATKTCADIENSENFTMQIYLIYSICEAG